MLYRFDDLDDFAKCRALTDDWSARKAAAGLLPQHLSPRPAGPGPAGIATQPSILGDPDDPAAQVPSINKLPGSAANTPQLPITPSLPHQPATSDEPAGSAADDLQPLSATDLLFPIISSHMSPLCDYLAGLNGTPPVISAPFIAELARQTGFDPSSRFPDLVFFGIVYLPPIELPVNPTRWLDPSALDAARAGVPLDDIEWFFNWPSLSSFPAGFDTPNWNRVCHEFEKILDRQASAPGKTLDDFLEAVSGCVGYVAERTSEYYFNAVSSDITFSLAAALGSDLAALGSSFNPDGTLA